MKKNMVISTKKLPKITWKLPGYYPELPEYYLKITQKLPENKVNFNPATYLNFLYFFFPGDLFALRVMSGPGPSSSGNGSILTE